jgi:hypothetical protein
VILVCLHIDMMSTCLQPYLITFFHILFHLIQAMVDNNFMLPFRNWKIMYMVIKALKLNHVIEVLKCFPWLQQLHIWVSW